jgi:hypothetical protein
MVYEQFFGDQERFWGWRCIFCGEIVDDVILENRRWLRAKVVPDKKNRVPFPGRGNISGGKESSQKTRSG